MSIVDRETITGAVVLLVGMVFLGLVYGGSGRSEVPGYDLTARFSRAEGVAVGSEIRMSGMVIGKVIAQRLDERFRAVIRFRVTPDIQVPKDSAAVIQTDGLLGGKYIALQPGGDEEILKPGAEMRYTQDSVSVADLLALIVSEGQARRALAQQERAAR